jgi:hypothetical protein
MLNLSDSFMPTSLARSSNVSDDTILKLDLQIFCFLEFSPTVVEFNCPDESSLNVSEVLEFDDLRPKVRPNGVLRLLILILVVFEFLPIVVRSICPDESSMNVSELLEYSDPMLKVRPKAATTSGLFDLAKS